MTKNPFDEDAGKLKNSTNEYRLHIACVKHLKSAFPGLRFFHVPNQTRNATEAFFNKQMGGQAGASDLVVTWKDVQLHIGAIELKSAKGRISNEQNRFLSSVASIGWKVAICRSVRELHDALYKWGIAPQHHSIVEPDLRSDNEKKADAFEFFKPSV